MEYAKSQVEIMDKGKKAVRILIVDDEECIREFIGYALLKRGFIIENAGNGKEALEKVAQNKPDIIILDVMMPLMDGLTVCKRLRENPDTQDIPIIFLSAQARIDRMIQGMPGATIKYIEKPCGLGYLLTQIDKLIL